MKKYRNLALSIVVAALLVGICGWYLQRHPIPVLQPAGSIGNKERNLIIFTALMSVLVVVPVFSLLGYIVWKYREGNTRAKYRPDQDSSHLAETIWWVVPTLLMVVISVVTWRSSYALDPYKQLPSKQATLHIQAVSMDWKWLFIYPDHHVASVNEVAIPTDRPVDFELTSDTIMSSFWIPSLGGQMYAMPGMTTHLNLVANKNGTYNGSTANISGKGFAGMRFTVKALPSDQYKQWLARTGDSSQKLTAVTYAQLARPTQNVPPSYYGSVDPNLYDTIMMKYMMPMTANTESATTGMEQ
jgi:cytochrome o ubiquinol oxidase subunit 2